MYPITVTICGASLVVKVKQNDRPVDENLYLD